MHSLTNINLPASPLYNLDSGYPSIFLYMDMASSRQLIFTFLFIFISLSHAQQSSKPKALLLPVSKDPSTLQYTTHLKIGTPLVEKSLVVDLGGRHLWLDCAEGYNSSTYRPAHCGSAPCSVAKPTVCDICRPYRWPGCTTNTCILYLVNPVTITVESGEVSTDIISIQSIGGSNYRSSVSISKFIFSCGRTWLLAGLASGVKGMLGLGRTNLGLATQLSSSFGGSFHKKFALCLPSTPKSNGVIFFGDAPYLFYPVYNTSKQIDVSSLFTYTRLYVSPVSTVVMETQGEVSAEYFVGVKSILVNKKPIAINSTLLSFNSKGIGGTRISTISPYTVLESSIYNAFVKMFNKEVMDLKIAKVAPVAPFAECYSTENMAITLIGIHVPVIAFVFENKNVYWELHGPNSMVGISHDVVCLGFLDGGLNPKTSIVIGAHQLQDTLLEFDLAASRLAFTPTLLTEEAECSNFIV